VEDAKTCMPSRRLCRMYTITLMIVQPAIAVDFVKEK